MDINIQATVGICNEFMKDNDSINREVSVVIAPIKVNINEDQSKVQVVSGCNLWRSCHNPNCWYSIESREKKKA